MNARVCSLVVACFAGLGAAAKAQVYSATPGVGVPTSGTLGTISSQLAVDGAASELTDVNVIVDVTHTYCGDLDLILVPPSGDVYVHLSSDNGGLGDNYRFTRFDQQAAASIATGAAPFSGTYQPEGGDVAWRLEASVPLPGPALASLDDLNGIDPNGTWIIIIDDDSLADSGQFEYWSLELNGAIDPLGPPLGTSPTGAGLASPDAVFNDETEVATLTVQVTPGSDPASTFASGSVIVDASAVDLGLLTLSDDGVFPDLFAEDLTYTAQALVPEDTAPGLYALPFTVADDQFRTGTGSISLGVLDAPPPCVSGLAQASFRDVAFNGSINDPDNDALYVDFGLDGQIDQLAFSGRYQAFSPSSRREARLRATAPDGSVYEISRFANVPSGPGVFELVGEFVPLSDYEDGSGTWTFEAWDSLNDVFINPDGRWDRLCVSVDLVTTNPTAAWIDPFLTLPRDGQTGSAIQIRVTPGLFPVSSGLAVVIDDSALGGTGSLEARDDGVAPDLIGGDNIFTAHVVVGPSTPLDLIVYPYAVTDAQGREFTGSLGVVVIEAEGACCIGDGCTFTTVGNCLNTLGGTFAGHTSVCATLVPLTTDGAGAFEDISATGILLNYINPDDSMALVPLPFLYNYFGTEYMFVRVVTNGFLKFGDLNNSAFDGPIPNTIGPNNAIYALWDDLEVIPPATVRVQALGTPGVDHRFIVQWTNVPQYNRGSPVDASTFQVCLFESGAFEIRYLQVSNEAGAILPDTTTIGFEDPTGNSGFQLPLSRADLGAQCPVSYRGSGVPVSSGVCDVQPACAPCAADFDQDGGVTGADIATFFEAFEQGLGCADVDGDGGVTGGDIGAFFLVFEAGGC